MSHARYITVLSHHQPIGSRSRTAVPSDVADELVQRMAAERVSQGVIRMMSPDSVFLPAVQKVLPETRYVPMRLPAREIENCYFVPPSTDRRPRVATLRQGWDWSKESWPEGLVVA